MAKSRVGMESHDLCLSSLSVCWSHAQAGCACNLKTFAGDNTSASLSDPSAAGRSLRLGELWRSKLCTLCKVSLAASAASARKCGCIAAPAAPVAKGGDQAENAESRSGCTSNKVSALVCHSLSELSINSRVRIPRSSDAHSSPVQVLLHYLFSFLYMNDVCQTQDMPSPFVLAGKLVEASPAGWVGKQERAW